MVACSDSATHAREESEVDSGAGAAVVARPLTVRWCDSGVTLAEALSTVGELLDTDKTAL